MTLVAFTEADVDAGAESAWSRRCQRMARSSCVELERRGFALDVACELTGLRIQLRDAWLREIYTPEGADIWIADVQKKGHTVREQLARLDQLRTGAYS